MNKLPPHKKNGTKPCKLECKSFLQFFPYSSERKENNIEIAKRSINPLQVKPPPSFLALLIYSYLPIRKTAYNSAKACWGLQPHSKGGDIQPL